MHNPIENSIARDFVVLISADAEWQEIKKILPDCEVDLTPYGEWFEQRYDDASGLLKPVVFMHGGWGKIAASGSTQYAIDHWHPKLVVNLGTCGGFEGEIQREQIILAQKTIVYDIFEQMGDPEEHILHYTTKIDTGWLTDPLPQNVIRTVLVSGDRDLFASDVPSLKSRYGAIAGDWESGAIAWVASKNKTPCLIIRGVTDLVGESGGEAYQGKVNYYYENTALVMKKLVDFLPQWLMKYAAFYEMH